MPTLDFKGKQHIYAHHLAVPYRPLIADPSRSAPSVDVCSTTPPPPVRSSVLTGWSRLPPRRTAI